jgi:hypothetical protein
MGTAAKCFRLENVVTRPATEAQLIEALLAFVNGQDVLIKQVEEVRRWSLWREQPSEEERAALVGVLERTMRDPRYALGITSEWGRASGAAIELGGTVPTSDHALRVIGDLRIWFAHMDRSIERRFVMVPSRRGVYSLVDYWLYRNVAAALTAATLLLIDTSRPHAGALRRCKGCKGLYVARRTRKGELANSVYCSSNCREQYHNSAARKG